MLSLVTSPSIVIVDDHTSFADRVIALVNYVGAF